MDLLEHCAPEIHPVTIAAVVQQESGGNPLALHDNTAKNSYRPQSIAEAAEIARKLILDGHSVDIGLAQINSKNLPKLGLTVEQVLDPCTNLQASQKILKEGWYRSGGDIVGTLSAYNTGKVESSVGQGYAQKVYLKANSPNHIVPSIPGGEIAPWVKNASNKTTSTDLSPVRLKVEKPVTASPLEPNGEGLRVKIGQ